MLKNTKIIGGLGIVMLIGLVLFFVARNLDPTTKRITILPGYEMSKEIGDFTIESDGNGTVKVYDAQSHREVLDLFQMVETYHGVDNYRLERVDSAKILLDCEAASPGTIQHCTSVKSVTPLRADDFFIAKYILLGEVASNEETSTVTYTILDVLLPGGTLLSGMVDGFLNDDSLRLIAKSFRKTN